MVTSHKDDENLKILIANKYFYLKGGAETVFFQERNFLKRQGHKVIDFSMLHPNNEPSIYSDFFAPYVDYHDPIRDNYYYKFLKTLNISANFIHNRKALSRLSALINKEKPQIAHLHNIYHQITPSIIDLFKKSSIKVILTLHDYKMICPIYTLCNQYGICEKCAGKNFYNVIRYRCQEGSFAKSLLLAIEAYWHKWMGSYEKVDLFIAPSQFMAELCGNYRLDKKKIKVVFNGTVAKNCQNENKDGNYSIYFGRVSSEKGIRTLLKAQMKSSKDALPLKVVGDGPLLDDLKKEFPFIDFVGYKKGTELQELVGNASFVVVPSEWYENCSMSILEAMACGKPVVGARVGGIKEQIDDRKTGLLFTMGDEKDLSEKLILLSQNINLRMILGKNARHKSDNEYSLTRHNEKLMGIYHSLIESGRN